MKKIIAVLVLSFMGISLYPNTEPDQDIQKVYAFSGLKLRQSPHMNAKVIKIIPFGENVLVKERTEIINTVEWLKGTWIKVQYNGREGYILDSFVSALPMPSNDYELTQRDADISYPLISWVEKNFKITASSDTIEDRNYYKIIQYFEDSIVLCRKESTHAFEATVEIPNIRISEAYNLVKSMFLTKIERELFEENATFIANKNNEIDKIRIGIDAPIEIKETPLGVLVKVTSYQYICSL